MRTILAMLLSLGLSAAVPCQKLSTPEEAIGRIINSGLLEGHDQKLIGGMGDAAAVIVTKVVGERQPTTGQMDAVLLVLNSAFAEVRPMAELEPRTALFVLQYLELSTKDPQLKERIARTREYIREQYKKK